jgi:hypothetical protein
LASHPGVRDVEDPISQVQDNTISFFSYFLTQHSCLIILKPLTKTLSYRNIY